MKAALLGLLVIGCSIPHPPPAPPRQTHLGLQFASSTLSNGLRVVLVQDPRATDVQVTMRYEVGAADDPDDQQGVAHLVEHLMFEQVLGSKSLFATLEDNASSFNAFTGLDTTTYLARAPKAQLDKLLSIEAVRMGFRCATINDSVFEREREVVINEVKQRTPTQELFRSVHSGLYPAGHPYRRLVTGTPASVGAITRQQACAFADAHYSPRNAVLVVSGDLQPIELDAALSKFLAKVANRPVTPRVPVAPFKAVPTVVSVAAPVDHEVLLVAWPTATDPVMRSRLRAMAPIVAAVIGQEVTGRVQLLDLGDERAEVSAVVVDPGPDGSVEEARVATRRALETLPSLLGKLSLTQLGEVSFHLMRQSGLYRMFAALDETSTSPANRDIQIAAAMAAGRDPRAVVSDELAAVGRMSRDDAVSASALFAVERATFVIAHPDPAGEKASEVALSPPIHDLGLRRDPPDPAEAHRPAPVPTHTIPAAIQRRLLPNGLHVVLAPISSVPTVELRLVFDAGTADEPASARGVAQIAAHGLIWQPRYGNDMVRFVAVGGTNTIDVGLEHTSFIARGLDMHVDILLAGLRRWVRDGEYDEDVGWVTGALRRSAKTSDLARTMNEAFRAAVYGDHPYRRAGLAHRIDEVSSRDAQDFRAAHYVPDNATLIIAGGFDPAIADRWIDYLFASWSGHHGQRSAEPVKPHPASLAGADTTAQVGMVISIPSSAPHLHQLIVTQMLDIVASDLRHQLGATYDLSTSLSEARLASSYVISGWMNPDRLHDALQLLDRRIRELASGGELTERTFVTARARVLAQLSTRSAADYAARIEHDVEMGREPLSDLARAAEISRLTLDQLSLADLELARAAIAMRGPKATITDAYAAIGRTPTFVEATKLPPFPDAPSRSRPSFDYADLEDALTDPAHHVFGVAATAGGAVAQMLDHGGSRGVQVAVAGTVWPRRTTGFGVQLAYGRFGGTFTQTEGLFPVEHSTSISMVRATAFAIATSHDRLWGAIFAGYHHEAFSVDDGSKTRGGAVAVGAEGGCDVYQTHGTGIGVYARGDAALFSSSNFSSVGVGLAVRY